MVPISPALPRSPLHLSSSPHPGFSSLPGVLTSPGALTTASVTPSTIPEAATSLQLMKSLSQPQLMLTEVNKPPAAPGVSSSHPGSLPSLASLPWVPCFALVLNFAWVLCLALAVHLVQAPCLFLAPRLTCFTVLTWSALGWALNCLDLLLLVWFLVCFLSWSPSFVSLCPLASFPPPPTQVFEGWFPGCLETPFEWGIL